MSIWGNAILPQKEGFVYGANEPSVPCLWFNTGGADVPEDPDVIHGLLLYIDEENHLIPLYPMTTIGAVYGLNEILSSIHDSLQTVINHLNEKTIFVSALLPVSGWIGESAPFTQTIAVDGILETDNPHYGVVLSGTQEQKLAQKEAFGYIDELKTADGLITFNCLEDKPDVDLTVQIECNRVCVISNISEAVTLKLDSDEIGYETTASIDGEEYGIKNATVNQEATAGSYNFTVL